MALLPAYTVMGNNSASPGVRRPLTVAECEAFGLGGSGSGEVNTGSNVGASGVGVYDSKSAADLRFRKIDPGSTKVTTTLNGQKIDVDVVPANFTGIPQSGVTNLTTDLGNKQALDATLTALAALDASAGVLRQTAADTFVKATTSEVLDLIGATRGTVLYRGASAWSALAVGVDGQVLTTHGAGADPTWVTPSGGSGLSQAQAFARLSYGA